jgi:hypothetical protein
MDIGAIHLTQAGTLRLSSVGWLDVLVWRSTDNSLFLETPFLEPSAQGWLSEAGNACFSLEQLMACSDPSLVALALRALEVFGG